MAAGIMALILRPCVPGLLREAIELSDHGSPTAP